MQPFPRTPIPSAILCQTSVILCQTGGRNTLTVSIRMSSQGALQSPVMKDGGTVFTFPGLQTSPFPDWLNPGLWTHLRVTARGADAPGENIKAVFAPGGARIFIR